MVGKSSTALYTSHMLLLKSRFRCFLHNSCTPLLSISLSSPGHISKLAGKPKPIQSVRINRDKCTFHKLCKLQVDIFDEGGAFPWLPPRSPRKKVGPKLRPASILTFSLPKIKCCALVLVRNKMLKRGISKLLRARFSKVGFIRSQFSFSTENLDISLCTGIE